MKSVRQKDLDILNQGKLFMPKEKTFPIITNGLSRLLGENKLIQVSNPENEREITIDFHDFCCIFRVYQTTDEWKRPRSLSSRKVICYYLESSLPVLEGRFPKPYLLYGYFRSANDLINYAIQEIYEQSSIIRLKPVFL